MADSFDVIIVGGGVAGTVAAFILAKEGLGVMLIEKGSFCGAKNMTGGRLYAHSLERIMPGFASEAPVERKIVNEKVSMLTSDSAVTLDFKSSRLGKQGQDSYVVLRSSFDRWLSDKAEEVGALIVNDIKVDGLIVDAGKVEGVICGEDQIRANVVILADGANSLLAEKIGMRKPLLPEQVAIGVKEVIALSSGVIDERFNLKEKEGVSWLFAGDCSNGLTGGGFLYTNKETISLGLVCGVSHIGNSNKTLVKMMDDFKKHPILTPLLKGGRLVEYSAHLVPEAGYSMMPELCRDGVVVIGDAAGLVINIGYMVRGMDLAITSAELASKAIMRATKEKDFSIKTLSFYRELMEQSYVIQDLKTYRNAPGFFENPRIFNGYPVMVNNLLADMFRINGEPSPPLRKRAMKHFKKVGLTKIFKDGIKGVRAL